MNNDSGNGLHPVWSKELDAWADYMKVAGVTSGTRELRLRYVRKMAEAVGVEPDAVSMDMLATWVARHEWSANTRRSAVDSYRGFYRWALETGRVRRSPAHQLPRVRVPRGVPKPTPDAAYRSALRCANELEWLAIRLAGQGGMRVGEVSRARREDLVEGLDGRWCLLVVGKGGHERMVPLPDDVVAVIRRRGPGWLFPSPARPGQPLTAKHLGKVISRCFEDPALTTHNLRHRAATKAYASSRDLLAVQELLGHAKPETTRIYTQVGPERVRAAMEGAA